MSMFDIDSAKIIDLLFPEFNWDELELPKYQQILERLGGIEELSSEVADYLKNKRIKIGYHVQYNSGGGWTALRNITLTPKTDPMNPYVLSLIIHETFHLKQSIWMRLSMQGELRAWQYQKKTYPTIARVKGNEIGDDGEAYPGTEDHWDKLAQLSAESRVDLETARDVMNGVASGYRADRLPLYPLPQELGYLLRQWKFKDAIQVVLNLIRGNT